MTDLLTLGIAFTAGAALASAFWTWRFSPAPRQMELMHQNVALTILASGACARLNDEELEDLEDEMDEKMKAAFGDGAGVEMQEVTLDE
ncbi:hypothetical protein M197_gp78 [Haloarcula hispanica tailed virus 2]|uniref:Uncharacterized protein n=1 Tax=Haloarcula hispanica tailed virus 2 TaxID=1273751 RepID=R4TKP0_9CAUD|nr:hypothetical protein M197_gp78 [Haloarcula hispanica tailed virus 2]AGM11242.1 hypothetical protein HHTV2_78 [Haloarcula hispanica tailed virus 2]